MIYIVYKIYADEPNKGYYWGKWKNPIDLAYACFTMANTGVEDIKVIQHEDNGCIEDIIEW